MTIAHYWYRLRRAEFDARLKGHMLELGMSAEEIKTVIEAESEPKEGDVVIGNVHMGHDRG